MLTEYNGFKLGDRVYWDGDGFTGSVDHGTISKVGGEVFFEDERGWNVWVKWDSDGKYEYIPTRSIQYEWSSRKSNLLTNEQEAAMLLLSLGYTVNKNQK